MNFVEYQTLSARTLNNDLAPKQALAMAALGIAGEAGECIDPIKKHVYHGHELDASKMAKELGDVLWYVAAIATTLGLNLNDVAQMNIDKLKARYPEGFSEDASKNRII